jgi:hypothetical protein
MNCRPPTSGRMWWQPPFRRGVFGGIELALEPIPPRPIPQMLKTGRAIKAVSYNSSLPLLFLSAHASVFLLGGSLDPSALKGNFRSRAPRCCQSASPRPDGQIARSGRPPNHKVRPPCVRRLPTAPAGPPCGREIAARRLERSASSAINRLARSARALASFASYADPLLSQTEIVSSGP